MITQTTSKQRISGAMKKKDRPEWMIEPCACAFCGPEKKVKRVVTYVRSVVSLSNKLTTQSADDENNVPAVCLIYAEGQVCLRV